VTESGNDKAGRAANAAIWREVYALGQAMSDTPESAPSGQDLQLCRDRDELVRRYRANEAYARKRGQKHRKPKCEFCGDDKKLAAHHINGDPWDNRPCNIGTLCGHCHRRMHSWIRPQYRLSGPDRRQLWFEVLNNARKGRLKRSYTPPIIQSLRASGQRLGSQAFLKLSPKERHAAHLEVAAADQVLLDHWRNGERKDER